MTSREILRNHSESVIKEAIEESHIAFYVEDFGCVPEPHSLFHLSLTNPHSIHRSSGTFGHSGVERACDNPAEGALIRPFMAEVLYCYGLALPLSQEDQDEDDY